MKHSQILGQKCCKGFTLIELLMVVAIIGLLSVTLFTFILPSINRGKDGKRKSDLHEIANALEEYYNNTGSYPPALSKCGKDSELSSILVDLPCEVDTTKPYLYIAEPASCDGMTIRCSKYRLLTDLHYDQDPDVAAKGCTINFSGQQGCHRVGSTVYNYGIASGRALAD